MNSLCPMVVHVLFISYILVIQTKGYSQSYETGGVCYWFSDRTETLPAANQTCAEMTGHLAQLHSREIFDSVIRNMKGHGNAYWVGLHKVITDYYWDNNDSPTTSQWNPSEPNDTGDCVRLTYTTSGHRLADNPCTLLYNFICEKPFEPGAFNRGSGRIQNAGDAGHCPMTTYPADGRLACASACILEPVCSSFTFNSTISSCTFFTMLYDCHLDMSEVTVTLVERQCVWD